MLTGEETEATTAMVRFCGGLFLFMGLVLFVNRWNTVNGKAGALGMVIAAVNSAAIGYGMDDGKFVFRGWYVFTGVFLLAALHLAFNANPMWTSKTLAEKEAKKAAEKAKKGN
jgi:hypothetical protein